MSPGTAERDHAVQLQMKALKSRDLQLWSVGVLLVLVMATGFVSLVLPRMIWAGSPHPEIPYLPQLVFGLLALIVLFNLYVFEQRRELNNARDGLLRELLQRERKASLPLIDPQTQLFNRHFLEHLLRTERARLERRGGSLGLLMVRLCGLSAVARTLGDLAADQYLLATAQILEQTFPALSLLVRYDENTFLALVPETSASWGAAMQQELIVAMEGWNQEPGRAHRMLAVSASETLTQGCESLELLRRLEQEVRRLRREADRPGGSMSPRCLFVACSEEVTRALRPQFESSGVAVETADNPAAALQLLRTQKFEGVVLDCETQAAVDSIAQVRSVPSSKAAVVLAVVDRGVSIEAVFKMGASFALPKPIVPGVAAPSVRAAYGLMLGERRRYFRHAVELPLSLNFGDRRAEGTLSNISEGGLAFRTSDQVAIGQVIRVQFSFPGRSLPIEIKGEVEWSEPGGKAGMRFVSMPEKSRLMLNDWLLHRLQAEAECPPRARGGPLVDHEPELVGR